jgi:hypothetical protein
MKLAALMDFPDDARHIFYESTMYAMMERLRQAGVSRVYLQYYGTKDYGLFWNHKAPTHREIAKTGELLPDYSSVFVEAAKKQGMETAVIMKPQEQGIWQTFSPYYAESRENPGINYMGGKLLMTTNFVRNNPQLRIKRRTWDIDPDADKKIVKTIRLFKQNNIHTRIKKENIGIYVSENNANYKKYDKDFEVTYSITTAGSDTISGSFSKDYPVDTITKKDEDIEVITISGISINEKFIAIEVSCKGETDKDRYFTNVPIKTIAIFGADGNEICASQGHASRFCPKDIPFLDAGFHFDDGFGEYFPETLDPVEGSGYAVICKGKDEYIHTSLCECEQEVMEDWMHWQEKAMDDGFDMVGNRIENHACHVDEPFAYGYNDCIKEEYFRRYGKCSEKEMSREGISKIRGDAYTELFKKSAESARRRGRKFILTLNVEMLYDPIPVARHMAYPMNVEWQWERWLEETQPDEINIRSYQMSPGFILNDPQCKHILDTARRTGIPMTLERYDYWDFAEDFKMVRDTGIFSSMTLYETNNIIQSDGKGGIVEIKPGLLKQLEKLAAK